MTLGEVGVRLVTSMTGVVTTPGRQSERGKSMNPHPEILSALRLDDTRAVHRFSFGGSLPDRAKIARRMYRW